MAFIGWTFEWKHRKKGAARMVMTLERLQVRTAMAKWGFSVQSLKHAMNATSERID